MFLGVVTAHSFGVSDTRVVIYTCRTMLCLADLHL